MGHGITVTTIGIIDLLIFLVLAFGAYTYARYIHNKVVNDYTLTTNDVHMGTKYFLFTLLTILSCVVDYALATVPFPVLLFVGYYLLLFKVVWLAFSIVSVKHANKR